MQNALLRLFPLVLLALSTAGAADLGTKARKVYVWPMRSAFDQYLAQELVSAGAMDVVVDPKLADAILTERIDRPFQEALDEFFPLPQSEEEEAKEAKENEDDGGDGGFEGLDFNRAANAPQGRPRGTIFLVHIQSRRVLWSTFLKEFDLTPNTLHEKAGDVVEALRAELGLIQ